MSLWKLIEKHGVQGGCREWLDRKRFSFWMAVGRRKWLPEGERPLSFGNHSCVFRLESEKELLELQMMAQTEKAFVSEMLDELESGDTFVDVGANVGVLSCFASKGVKESGSVLAVEPYPPNKERLRENIELNGLSNVEVVDFVFSDSSGVIEMSGGGETDGAAGISTGESGDVEVEAIRGDDWFSENNRSVPEVVKIDVEGAEGQVVDGFREILSSERCRAIFIEVHHPTDEVGRASIEDYGWTVDELEAYLEEIGFELEFITDRGNESHIVGWK